MVSGEYAHDAELSAQQVGRPVCGVEFSWLGDAPDTQQVLADLDERRSEFSDDRLTFFGITVDPDDIRQGRMREQLPGIRFFQDFGGDISMGYGALPQGIEHVNPQADYSPFTLLLDERLRVLEPIPLTGDGVGHVQQIIDAAATLPDLGTHEEGEIQAPVLIVPRIFELDFCRHLINLYEQHGGDESGAMRDENGKTVGFYDYGTKRRRDYEIEDEDLQRQCMEKIHDRLVPEIRKAYQFHATRMERYIIACYEGEHGGHFRAHRDNTTKGTAHRRFAVSLNLNSEDYEGGYLWFPEFGRKLLKPPTGGACVFSCSLLHAATPVMSGTRYVFLPFLYDDAAAKIRELLDR